MIGNDVPQEDRTLFQQISDSVNATIRDAVGTGTIVAETMIPSSDCGTVRTDEED